VPFILQKPNLCGPAALAMVANYHGRAVTQEQLATGSLTIDLLDQARRLGFWARQYRGHRTDLRQKLAAGVPLIVRGEFGANEHFFVALRLDPFRETVTVHTDARPFHEMRFDDFDRFWERGGRWTLLVCPGDQTPWRLSADEHNDLGVHCERTGQFGLAAAHYRTAAELAPRNAWFPMNLGNALAKQKLMSEAAQAYRQAVARDPNNPDALNNLAWAFAELGANLDEAAEFCRRALALQPAHRAYYLDTLGAVLLKRGDTAAAITAFQSALAATTDRQTRLRETIQRRLQNLPQ